MTTSIVANRIYDRKPFGASEGKSGRIAAEDIVEMAPDSLLLRGLKPPTVSTTAGGVVGVVDLSAMNDKDGTVNVVHPVRACAAFEVVKLPTEENQSRGNPMKLAPGDVVLCFNAAVDPLLGNELAVTNMYIGVQAVLERAK